MIKYVWSYRLIARDKKENYTPDIIGYILMPTRCGATVANELATRYETHFLNFLNCLGEIDE